MISMPTGCWFFLTLGVKIQTVAMKLVYMANSPENVSLNYHSIRICLNCQNTPWAGHPSPIILFLDITLSKRWSDMRTLLNLPMKLTQKKCNYLAILLCLIKNHKHNYRKYLKVVMYQCIIILISYTFLLRLV